MDDIQVVPAIITAFLAVVSPIVVSVGTTTNMSSRTKNWVALGVSFVIALVYMFLTGGFNDPGNLVITLGVVFAIQQVVYRQLLVDLATKLEANVGMKSKVDDTPREPVAAKAPDGSEVVMAVPTGEVDAVDGNEEGNGNLPVT